MSITPTGNGSLNKCYSLLPYAGQLIVDDFQMKINGVDVHDTQHSVGNYCYGAFAKMLLTKPRERETYAMLPINDAGGTIFQTVAGINPNPNAFGMAGSVQSDISSDTTIESLGPANLPIDSQMIFPSTVGDKVMNLNACYYKDLEDSYLNYLSAVATGSQIPGALTAAKTGSVKIIIRPYDGAWRVPTYLPTNTRVDITLKLAGLHSIIGTYANNNDPLVVVNNLSLLCCRVIPQQDSMTEAYKANIERPFIYNILNARTDAQEMNAMGAGSNATVGPFLTGVIPNVVVVQLINSTTYDRTKAAPFPTAGAPAGEVPYIHAWDTHPYSSGFLRKHGPAKIIPNAMYNQYTADAWYTDPGYPQLNYINIQAGTKRLPLNNQFTNLEDQNLGLHFTMLTYDAYVKQCMQDDKPWLSYRHWRDIFTVYVFNCTNNDKGLMCDTDETNIGSITVNMSFANACPAQKIIVTGLYYSSLAIDKERRVTKVGY